MRRADDGRTVLTHNSTLTHQIIGLAMPVDTRPGPGLLENVCERCLCHESDQANRPYERQVNLPLVFDDVRLHCCYRADVIVNREVLVEIKSIEHMLPLHEAQLLTCLRLSSCRVGLLLNFNTVALKDGIKRRAL